jgi:hypothetical protein
MKERYSINKAAEEADILQKKVTTGKADDYAHAELQHDYSESERVAQEFDRVSCTIIDLYYNVDKLQSDERVSTLRSLEESMPLWKTMLRYSLNAHIVIERLEDLLRVTDNEKDEPSDNEFVKFGLRLIEELAPEIEECYKVNGEGTLGLHRIMRLYHELIEQGDRYQQMAGAHFLSQHMDWFSQMSKGLIEYRMNTQRLSDIIRYGRKEERFIALEILEKFLNDTSNNEEKIYIATKLLEMEDKGAEYIARRVILNLIAEYGLPYFDITSAWTRSSDLVSQPQRIRENLECMDALEKKNPGICIYLYKENGICDFGRYPVEMLEKQYEERENTNSPYGVVMYPRDDWNGAFYHNKDAFEGLLKDLKGEFLLRVAECEGKMDIARMLLKFDKTYGGANGNKISLLILGGHGTENSIRFGNSDFRGSDDEKHVLHTKDLEGKGVRKTGNFFDEKPTIILASCSTGAEGGIAQELSKVFNAKVIAPKIPTNVKSYHASKNRGQEKFRFHAQYRDENAKNLYQQGGQVSQKKT